MKRCLDALLVTVLALSLIGCSKEAEEKITVPTEPSPDNMEKSIKDAADATAKTIDDAPNR